MRFHQGKAFTIKVDNRSYAQVLAFSKSTSVNNCSMFVQKQQIVKSTSVNHCNEFVQKHQNARPDPGGISRVKDSLVKQVVNNTLSNTQKLVARPSVAKPT